MKKNVIRMIRVMGEHGDTIINDVCKRKVMDYIELLGRPIMVNKMNYKCVPVKVYEFYNGER